MGTTTLGSQLNGKFEMAIVGWLNANCWNGVFWHNITMVTIFISKPKLIKFQIINILFDNLFFKKPK